MTSRISTLCSGRYMQVIKSLGHHLSGRWSVWLPLLREILVNMFTVIVC